MSEFVLDETERIHGGPGGVRVPVGRARRRRRTVARRCALAVEGGKARVGTAEGSTLRLADRAVSRIHCELEVQADVVDAPRSREHERHVRRRRARARRRLRVGAVVRCGGTTFCIDAVERADVPALSASKSEFGELVGESFEMRRVYAVLERVAQSGHDGARAGRDGHRQGRRRALGARRLSARAPGPSFPSTAAPSRRTSSRASSSATCAAPSPAPSRTARRLRGGARRDALPRRDWRDAARDAGEAPARDRDAHASAASAPRKETDVDVRIVCATNRTLARDGQRRDASARTSTIASPSSRSRCRRSARAGRTSRRSRSTSTRRMSGKSDSAAGFVRRSRSPRARGPATCASSETRSSAR